MTAAELSALKRLLADDHEPPARTIPTNPPPPTPPWPTERWVEDGVFRIRASTLRDPAAALAAQADMAKATSQGRFELINDHVLSDAVR